MSKNKLGKANDKHAGFDQELTLAELIQNAAARGLKSTRGSLFASQQNACAGIPVKQNEESIVKAKGAVRKHPPKRAKCACALGAMALTPKLTNPLTIFALNGNDAIDEGYLPDREDFENAKDMQITVYGDERSMQVGLAYEQALRD